MNYRSHTQYCGNINERIKGWKKHQDEALEEQMYNPFSSMYRYKRQLSKDDPEYGTPMKGTKTFARGKKAAKRVAREISDLCDIIYGMGAKLRDGSIGVKFGRLFATYVGISDKVVGMLIRARKHGYVDFEGEILYQRQDEGVLIRLIKLPDGLTEEYEQLTVTDMYGAPCKPSPYYCESEEGDSGSYRSDSDRASSSQADEDDVATVEEVDKS